MEARVGFPIAGSRPYDLFAVGRDAPGALAFGESGF